MDRLPSEAATKGRVQIYSIRQELASYPQELGASLDELGLLEQQLHRGDLADVEPDSRQTNGLRGIALGGGEVSLLIAQVSFIGQRVFHLGKGARADGAVRRRAWGVYCTLAQEQLVKLLHLMGA
jgi:hypothetical protein